MGEHYQIYYCLGEDLVILNMFYCIGTESVVINYENVVELTCDNRTLHRSTRLERVA